MQRRRTTAGATADPPELKGPLESDHFGNMSFIYVLTEHSNVIHSIRGYRNNQIFTEGNSHLTTLG